MKKYIKFLIFILIIFPCVSFMSACDSKSDPVSFSVTFNSDGGSSVNTIENVETGSKINKPEDPTKEGYIFNGWFIEDKKWDFETDTISSNITLKAHWKPATYTITYNLNDSQNNPNNPAEFTIESKTIELKAPTKQGYAFAGWYDNEDFTGNPITTIPQGTNEDKEFFAKFTINTYSITYITNVSTESFTKNYTVEDLVILTIPELPGKTIAGWIDTTNDNDIITTIPKGTTGDKILELSWKYITYTITYETYGGTFPVQANTTFNIDSSVNLSIPQKPHYTFLGWFDDSNFETANNISQITVGTIGNKTFYAKWSAVTYTISYHLNNGTLSGTQKTSYTVEDLFDFEIPTRTGYEFKGWFTSSTLESNTKVDSISMLAPTFGNIHLYAKWQPLTYSITYKTYDNAVDNSFNKTSFTIETETFDIQDVTRTGYNFIGWFDSENFETATKVEQVTVGTTGNIELFANWQIITYSITYITNEGTLSASPKTSYTVEDEFTFEIPTKTGYEFKGWFTTSTFEIETLLNKITHGSINDIEVYGKWQIITYSIIYHTNNGTLSGLQKTSYTVEDEFTLEIPTRTGYEFKGWFTTSTFEIETLLNKITHGSINDIEVYGKWEVITYSISYITYDDSVDNSANETSFTIHTDSFDIVDITRYGYLFLGWFDSENFETANKVKQIEKGTCENIVLFAKYSDTHDHENYYKISNKETLSSYSRTENARLYSDIDLEAIEWDPINLSNIIFDGNNFTISNFKITTVRDYNGFFKSVENSMVSNLKLELFTISYSSMSNSITSIAGGLIGYVSGSTINNCHTSGKVSVTLKFNTTAYSSKAGGLIGYVSDSTISNSSSSVNVSALSAFGNAYSGGLIGTTTSSTILNCYSIGDVSSTCNNDGTRAACFSGGLIGCASDSTFSTCYSISDVTASSNQQSAYAGGLIGSISSMSTITNSYSVGQVSASTGEMGSNHYSYAGGLVASLSSSTITDCYRLENQTITSLKGSSRPEMFQQDGTVCLEGTSASMETIWAFIKDTWDTTVWDLSDDKNPTLKQSQN